MSATIAARPRFAGKCRLVLLLLLLMSWAACMAGAQQAGGPGQAPARQQAGGPRGFRSISLGMSLKAVEQALLADPLFDYRGEPDVSFLPLREQTLIETGGSSFISRAYFQFHDGALYIMTLELDQGRLDYFTVFTTLSGKYGQATSISPSEAVWSFPGVRLSLERPLRVKYIDATVFAALQEQGKAASDLQELSKERFLQLF